MSTITVKVVRMGEGSQVVELDEGASVMDALVEANLPTSGVTCNVNGRNASTAERLSDRQTLVVSTKVAGG